MKKHHSIGFVAFTFLIIIGAILLNHAKIHDGNFYQVNDFQNAIFAIFKSHEGIVLLVGIIGLSVVVSHYSWRGK